ncbi:MAG TPA: anti-sigma factor [Opitutaceae bacterium]|nr:anti-sigma factor [Opitutaceae bacterium]
MNCEETGRWLSAHLDCELDLAKDAEVTAHLQGCPACASRARRLRETAAQVRSDLPRFAPPAALEARIRASAGAAAPFRPARRWGTWEAVGILAAACVVFVAGYHLGSGRTAAGQAGDDLISAIVRAREDERIIDVVSSDRHTVKPWLAARLDFSPPVADLAAEGYPLVGGRLDRLSGRQAAAVVYQRNQHTITVFIWEGPGPLPATGARLGYGVRAWKAGGLDFAAVSDVAPADLDAFVRLFKAIR